MRQGGKRAGLVALLGIALLHAAPASADTTTLNFDSLAAGATVTSLQGVTFEGSPTVFAPSTTTTSSPPNALHTRLPCGDDRCANGMYELAMTFASPASRVSLKVGLADERAPDEFPVGAQLTAFDAAGRRVASTGDVDLGSGGYKPITTTLTTQSTSTNIVRAVVSVGKTDAFDSFRRRVNVDDVQVTNDPPPPPPPAPTVTITSPAPDAQLLRATDVRIAGNVSVSAPARVARFCTTVGLQLVIPATCAQAPQVRPDGSFSGVPVRGLRAGANVIEVWVEDTLGRTALATVRVFIGNDLRVTGIDVLQGVGNPRPFLRRIDNSRPYDGAKLIQDRPTAIRVYANAVSASGRAAATGVKATLRGFDSQGRPLPGRAVAASNGDRNLAPGPDDVSPAERADWNAAYDFWVPSSWTRRGRIRLRVDVNPATLYPSIPECTACRRDNSMELTDVEFAPTKVQEIYPVALVSRQFGGVGPASANFAEARAMVPFGSLAVHDYVTTIDISDVLDDAGLDVTGKRDRLFSRTVGVEDGRDLPGKTIGIYHVDPSVIDMRSKQQNVFFLFPPRIEPIEIGDNYRTFTITHELLHSYGILHASPCTQTGASPGLPFTGYAPWPPDERGELQGIGMDTRTSPPQLLIPGGRGSGTDYLDLMSYCSTFLSWISVRNWNDMVDNLRGTGFAKPQVRPAATPGSALRVSVSRNAAGAARIGGVTRSAGTTSGTSGPYRLVALGDDGRELASVAFDFPNAFDGEGQESSFDANLPATGTSAIELHGPDGAVLDRRTRSANPPRVSVRSPGHVRGRGNTTLRWQASDADGDRLETKVEYSADGGRHWGAIGAGGAGTYAIPSRLFTRSRNARVRVTADDGFNTASATSARFRADGAPPRAEITSPAPGSAFAADAPVQVAGQGFDGRDRLMAGRSLTWFAGKRRVGRGSAPLIRGLKPGTRVLRLVARERGGRTGSARIRLRITPVAPRLDVLRVPKRVSRRARRVRLQLRATVPCTLRVGKQRFSLRGSTQTIRVRVRPGRRPLALTLRLSSGGRTARVPVAIARS